MPLDPAGNILSSAPPGKLVSSETLLAEVTMVDVAANEFILVPDEFTSSLWSWAPFVPFVGKTVLVVVWCWLPRDCAENRALVRIFFPQKLRKKVNDFTTK